MKTRVYNFLWIFIICFFFLNDSTPARAALTIKFQDQSASIVNQDIKIQAPSPRINLPGLNLVAPEQLQGTIDAEGKIVIGIPYLAEYIAAVYKYAVAIASILAVVMIIVGGFQWTASGGSPDAITSAKKRIVNAVTGLVIALGSYTLLYTINPELVQFRSLQITYIQPKNLNYQEGGDNDTAIDFHSAKEKAVALGIICPGTKGNATIEQIVKSMQYKLSYRFGGKGQAPEYKDAGQYASFAKTCPQGNLCFDCSGFVNFVYACAGIQPSVTIESTLKMFTDDSGTVARIVNGATKFVKNVEEIKDTQCDGRTLSAVKVTKDGKETTEYKPTDAKLPSIQYDPNPITNKPQVNCVDLEPGDLIGWKAGDNGATYGHVVMYIGDGNTAEASGGFLGRQANANPTFKTFADFKNAEGYNFKYIRRAP